MPFLTPNYSALSSAVVRRSLCLPGELWYLLDGAVQELTESFRFEEHGEMSPLEIAEWFGQVLDEWQDCMMIGAVIPFATYELPSGVLLCDGSSYSSEDYPKLYAVSPPHMRISIPGFPSEFFVPDLTGRFVLGTSRSDSINTQGGEDEHELTIGEIPEHTHGYIPPVANIDLEAPGAPDILAAGVGLEIQTGSSGGGSPHNNMPPYTMLVYGIIAQ